MPGVQSLYPDWCHPNPGVGLPESDTLSCWVKTAQAWGPRDRSQNQNYDNVKFNLPNIQVGLVEHVLPGGYTVNRFLEMIHGQG